MSATKNIMVSNVPLLIVVEKLHHHGEEGKEPLAAHKTTPLQSSHVHRLLYAVFSDISATKGHCMRIQYLQVLL